MSKKQLSVLSSTLSLYYLCCVGKARSVSEVGISFLFFCDLLLIGILSSWFCVWIWLQTNKVREHEDMWSRFEDDDEGLLKCLLSGECTFQFSERVNTQNVRILGGEQPHMILEHHIGQLKVSVFFALTILYHWRNHHSHCVPRHAWELSDSTNYQGQSSQKCGLPVRRYTTSLLCRHARFFESAVPRSMDGVSCSNFVASLFNGPHTNGFFLWGFINPLMLKLLWIIFNNSVPYYKENMSPLERSVD
jgi:hypothetical protein